MDTRQVIIIKRVATCLVLGLVALSLGLMLFGWTVPTKAAFEAGVFGFQLFPIAVLAVLGRIVLPIVLNTWFGKALSRNVTALFSAIPGIYAWFREQVVWSSPSSAPKKTSRNSNDSGITSYDYQAFFHYPATGRDPIGYPIDESDPLADPELVLAGYKSVVSDDDDY